MSIQYRPFTHDHYRVILQSALDSGYRFIGFSELDAYRGEEQSICLLRHDCDNDLMAAVEIARIEATMGVRSTYFLMLRSALYNVMSIPNAELVGEIVAGGHWIGLHFDEQYYGDAEPGEIAGYVDEEREWLGREVGVPVDVVSFHQPSNRVLENRIKLNCLNTYDHQDLEGVYYLSDSNMTWKEESPEEFFRAGRQPRLQLLLHPEWWTSEEKDLEGKWDQMLRHNFELMQRSMLQRERAYKIPRDVELRLRLEDKS